MNDLQERLNTFQTWPFSHVINPIKLAQAGLYYFEDIKAIKCAFCRGVILYNWSQGDNPDLIHQKYFPFCPYVQTDILPRLEMHEALQDSNAVIKDQNYYDELSNIGLLVHRSSIKPEYCTYAVRLQTFDKWPKFLLPKPEHLAEAGFYYKGCGDEVFCFHCGGGVKQWEPTDDPWIEHAKYYSKCNYVVLSKGIEYVKQIFTKDIAVDNNEAGQETVTNARLIVDEEKSKNEQIFDEEQLSLILEENRKLKESRLCKICLDKDACVVFLPCRHLAVCADCVVTLEDCPVCRKHIKILIKTYL